MKLKEKEKERNATTSKITYKKVLEMLVENK
jgi:hypothetical protein